jgi:hypothetical protein
MGSHVVTMLSTRWERSQAHNFVGGQQSWCQAPGPRDFDLTRSFEAFSPRVRFGASDAPP